MTDLLNGKIDFFGFEVNPSTTLQEFETAVGSKFTKEVDVIPKTGHVITTFVLNGDIGVWEFAENDTRFSYELYGMKFLNVVIDFSQEKIWQIKLITNMVSFVVGADGKRRWSSEKENQNFEIMNNWTIKALGKPNSKLSSDSALWYEFDWGEIQPTPLSAWGSPGNSTLYITYRK